MQDNLFLIGPMGAGKTSLGKLLSAALGYEFVDSDHHIVQTTGVDIPTIFYYEGEAGFRERELKAVDELTRRKNIVLATGGGAVLRKANRRRLRRRGCVIYLKVSVAQQLARTLRDTNRPLLQTADPERRLRELARERAPIYEATAHYTIDTDRGHIRTLKQRILAAYKDYLFQKAEEAKQSL